MGVPSWVAAGVVDLAGVAQDDLLDHLLYCVPSLVVASGTEAPLDGVTAPDGQRAIPARYPRGVHPARLSDPRRKETSGRRPGPC